MELSPKILNALRNQYDAMGFKFNPKGLANFEFDGVDLATSLGGSPKDIAAALIIKLAAADIERDLPKYVRPFGNGATLVSMPRLACLSTRSKSSERYRSQ